MGVKGCQEVLGNIKKPGQISLRGRIFCNKQKLLFKTLLKGSSLLGSKFMTLLVIGVLSKTGSSKLFPFG